MAFPCRNYLPLGHCEYSSTCVCLSCPPTVLLSSQTWFLHKCLPFSVLLTSVLWHASPVWPDIATTVNLLFTKSSNNSREEKKLSKYNVWPRPSYLPCQFCHCRMVCCHVLCCVLSVLSKVYFHVICVSSWVTKFENFDVETLAFLWYVLFENHPPFEGNNKFVNSQIFRRVVKFGKCASQNFKQVSYLLQSVQIFVCPIRFIPVVTKM